MRSARYAMVGIGLAALCACASAQEALPSYDFEAGDDLTAYEGLTLSNARAQVVSDGPEGTGHCLQISSTKPGRYTTLQIKRPMTLVKNLILSFDHREEIQEGKKAAYLGILLFDKEGKQWFGSDKFTPEWRHVEVPIARLRSPNEGVLSLGKVLTHVNLYGRAEGDAEALMTVWLDNIRLHTRAAAGKLTDRERTSTANPPLFNWARAEGLMRLEYSRDPSFPTADTVGVATEDNYHTPAEPLRPGKWYWRVHTSTELSEGWSDTEAIEITPQAHRFGTPPVPVSEITQRARPRVIPDGPASEDERERLIKQAESLARQGVPDDPPPYAPGNPDWPTWIDWYGKVAGGITGATGRRLQQMARIYVQTADPEVGDRLKQMALKAATWDPEGGSTMGRGDIGAHHLLRGLNWCYDALYDGLTGEERAQLRDIIVQRALQFERALNPFPAGGREYNNHAWLRAFGLAESGFVLMGDHEPAADWAEYVRQLYIGRFLCALGYQGDNNEGISYWGYGLWFVIDYADMMKHVCGCDLFKHPWLAGTARFPMYTAPPGAWAVSFADTGKPNHGVKGPAQTGHVRNLAVRTRDPYALWYAGGRQPEDGLAPRPPVDLPQSIHYRFIGWALHNTSIVDGAQGVTFAMRSGPFYAGHQHEDQNSFVIHAYGEKLAIDSGYYDWYGSEHFTKYSVLTRAHNAILVNGQDQHSRRAGADGVIKAYFDSAGYGYTVGDASDRDMYGGQLEGWDRRALFIKPGFVVIHDLLEAAQEPAKYDWLLHTVAPIEIDQQAQAFSLACPKAALRGRVLAPQDVALTVTEGYPVEPVDGYSTRPVPPERYAHEWTLTATPQAQRQQEDFLVAMQIQRLADEPDDASFEKLSTESSLGVRVSLADETHTTVFRRRGVDGSMAGGDIEADAECISVSLDDEGNVRRVCAVEARSVHHKGDLLVQTSGGWPCDLSLLATEAGVLADIELAGACAVDMALLGGAPRGLSVDGEPLDILQAQVRPSGAGRMMVVPKGAPTPEPVPGKPLSRLPLPLAQAEDLIAFGELRVTLQLEEGRHRIVWGPEPDRVPSHPLPDLRTDSGALEGYAQRQADGLLSHWWGQIHVDAQDRYELVLEGWTGKHPPQVNCDGRVLTLEPDGGLLKALNWLDKGEHFVTLSGDGGLDDLALRPVGVKMSAARMLPAGWDARGGSIVIEAEDVASEGTVKGKIVKKVGASGGIAHTTWDTNGQWAEWQFDVEAEGDYELAIKAASVYDTILRTLHLDGEPLCAGVEVAAFASTGGWCRTQDDWRHFLVTAENGAPARVRLSAGTHRLKMERITGSMNLDLLVWQPVVEQD